MERQAESRGEMSIGRGVREEGKIEREWRQVYKTQ